MSAGNPKKSKGASARPANQKGTRWWLSMVDTDPVSHKVKAMFYELIPKLAYENKDGELKWR